MSLNLIYFSPTGSTKKAVETLASAWDLYRNDIDISIPDTDYSTYNFTSEDLCIIGVPSFGGRVPPIATDHLRKMKSDNTPTIIVTTYGNRAYEDTLLELKNEAKECGFKVVAAVSVVTEHSIMHQFATGRPNNKDLDEIVSFGKKIKDSISSNTTTSDLQVPGNMPYREFSVLPIRPKAKKDCPKCGVCASVCPTKSIPIDSPDKTDDTCISCMRCISVCPNGARSVNKIVLLAASQKLKKACSGYKENELFI